MKTTQKKKQCPRQKDHSTLHSVIFIKKKHTCSERNCKAAGDKLTTPTVSPTYLNISIINFLNKNNKP